MRCVSRMLLPLLLAVGVPAHSGVLDSLCVATPPDPESALKVQYDLYCPNYISTKLAEEQKAAAEAERKARKDEKVADQKAHDEKLKSQIDSLEKAAGKLKPADSKMPDLSSFASAGQRNIADVAYISGKKIATQLALAAKSSGGSALVVSSEADALRWMPRIDVEQVVRDLQEIEAKANELKKQCVATKAIDRRRTSEMVVQLVADDVAIGVAGLELVVNLAANVAQMFQPELLSGVAVTAPVNLQGAVVAGIQSNWMLSDENNLKGKVFLGNPPTMDALNPVVSATRKTAKALDGAREHLQKLQATLKKEEKKKQKTAEKDCVESLVKLVDARVKDYDALVKATDADIGSKVDQAARKVAMGLGNVTAVLAIEQVVAGGGVNGHRRFRYFAPTHLIATGDIAVVARWYDVASGAVTVAYDSRGCGRLIKLGGLLRPFDRTYGKDCR